MRYGPSEKERERSWSAGTARTQLRDQRGNTITRVERFGLGINRVDQFLISFGVEGMFPVIRPFVEYNLGIASNDLFSLLRSAIPTSGQSDMPAMSL